MLEEQFEGSVGHAYTVASIISPLEPKFSLLPNGLHIMSNVKRLPQYRDSTRRSKYVEE